jgi:multicomponent Na+:H+ antiporter subunit G
MSVTDIVAWLQAALIVAGAFFFLTGTLGLIRFPDVFSRLHALTKADNLGLGLIVFGLAWQSGSVLVTLKLLLVWLLAMCASALSGHLIAQYALRGGEGKQP